jgi:hypothetical protein
MTEQSMTIHEIVKKLIGEIRPVGETNTDNARFENLKQTCELVDELLHDIDGVIYYKDRVEYSMSRAGKYADAFFDRIGIKE